MTGPFALVLPVTASITAALMGATGPSVAIAACLGAATALLGDLLSR